MNNITLRAKVS
jgi:hypothetical protein